MKARKQLLEDLEKKGHLEKTEKYDLSVGTCYRCHNVIEPYLSDQWFVKMDELAEPAIEAVKTGKLRFHPDYWSKTYLHWMENIRDWCISRQLWWGHRIPVWYAEDGTMFVSVDRPTADECPGYDPESLVQDEDVLDTWFSSWLWPFSTFGWPEKTPELQKFYPTKVLVTASEIIFLWVARMVMAGYEFMGEAARSPMSTSTARCAMPTASRCPSRSATVSTRSRLSISTAPMPSGSRWCWPPPTVRTRGSAGTLSRSAAISSTNFTRCRALS